MKKIILSVIILLSSVAVSAQTVDDVIEVLKSDIKTGRKQLITETMAFADSQSKVFWPIYQEFEYELEKLADKRMAIIKDFAEHYDNLSDKKADELVNSHFKFLEDRLKLNKKYYKKFSKALTPTVAAKYMQLENEIQMVVDMQVAAQLPYFEGKAKEVKK